MNAGEVWKFIGTFHKTYMIRPEARYLAEHVRYERLIKNEEFMILEKRYIKTDFPWVKIISLGTDKFGWIKITLNFEREVYEDFERVL